ncbi:MAG: hypothetical protein KAK00_00495 [Nanoarchaeota archaeon]|nr:hypothetical protein [Nanoarchaeota archaeon]
MKKLIIATILCLFVLSSVIYAGPINVDEGFAELMAWSGLYSYPSACPAGSAITQLDDSVTCTDGWVNIDGDNWTGNMNAGDYNITNISNVDANGNITAENVFILSDIYLHTDYARAVSNAGTWYNISFTHNGNILKQNIQHTYNDNTNDTITILNSGIYDFKYAANFNNTNANPDDYAVIRLTINGIELNGSGMGRHMSKANANVPITGCTRYNLTAGDEIKMQFTSTSTDTSLELQSGLYLDHYDSARLCIVKIR